MHLYTAARTAVYFLSSWCHPYLIMSIGYTLYCRNTVSHVRYKRVQHAFLGLCLSLILPTRIYRPCHLKRLSPYACDWAPRHLVYIKYNSPKVLGSSQTAWSFNHTTRSSHRDPRGWSNLWSTSRNLPCSVLAEKSDLIWEPMHTLWLVDWQ